MSNCSSAGHPTGLVDVAVLKSWDFGEWREQYGNGSALPYRIDHLREFGLEPRWTDAVHQPHWVDSRVGGVVRRVESATVPFAQAGLMARRVRAAPITLAMFESEANALAVARRVWPGTDRRVFAVMTCWLAHLLTVGGRARRSAYRWAYRSVDRLYCLSDNQAAILADQLRLPEDRVRFLPFGVDDETFRPTAESDGGYILAVGRDRGRDWTTLLRAVDGIGVPVKLCCRPRDLAGLRIPAGTEVLGYVDRNTYRDLLGRARAVAVVAHPVVYPSGQSVLLEAMAMGRACVVTATEALAGYVTDGVTTLTVPVGDPAAVRERLVQAAADDALRARLGRAARRSVEESFTARRMWQTVADDLLNLRTTRWKREAR